MAPFLIRLFENTKKKSSREVIPKAFLIPVY
uniref:Uncharacterized protein n=1 Tax=Enterococcus phage PMBT56 TaxID=3229530 RepID=A0AB39C699_9CAUD